MKGLAVIFILAGIISCKKDTTPATNAAPQTTEYEVAFKLYSAQPEFEFVYNDVTGTHSDSIFSHSDSIVTEVQTGSNMQFLQRIQCTDTLLPDGLIMKVYMNGKTVTDSASKAGTGKLVVGVQLQSLL